MIDVSLLQTAAAEAVPVDYWSTAFVFVLATFIGLGVIRRVSRLLYTPLMSLTNAISGIALVGSLVLAGADRGLLATSLGAIAVTASTITAPGFIPRTASAVIKTGARFPGIAAVAITMSASFTCSAMNASSRAWVSCDSSLA